MQFGANADIEAPPSIAQIEMDRPPIIKDGVASQYRCAINVVAAPRTPYKAIWESNSPFKEPG
jgi:hypothetical protein